MTSVRIKKWGNSHGLILSKNILEHLGVSNGDELDIKLEKNRLLLEPSTKIRGYYRLEDLLAQIPEDYEPKEESWGTPQGREIW